MKGNFSSRRQWGWLAMIVALASPAAGQYELKTWANFDDGKMPEKSITIGMEPDKAIKVVETKSVTGVHAAFRSKEAAAETGSHVLELTAQPGQGSGAFSVGLITDFVLDRDSLGPEGRALLQADFYIPEGNSFPSIGVLGVEDTEEIEDSKNIPALNKGYYRFGITKDTHLYFSCMLPKVEKAATFRTDKVLLAAIPKPGWHRFALVFKGPTDMYCYLDGRETNYSPVGEPNLRKLRVGILLAEPERQYKVYVDNISIQVSKDAPALPNSPYTEGWKFPPGPHTERSKTNFVPTMASLPTTETWLDPIKAWDVAQQKKKPMLLYFYAPGLAVTDKMEEYFKQDKAKSFLAQYVCARVDVNQLQGGSIAQRYSIYKVPTMLLIAPDVSWNKRAVYSKNDDWDSFVSHLK